MKKLQITVALAIATVGLAGVANAQTVDITTPTTYSTSGNNLTNGNPNVLNTSVFTMDGTTTLISSIGGNIENQNTLIIVNGTLLNNDQYNILNEDNGTTTISGGTFTGITVGLSNIVSTSGTVNISGGTFATHDDTDTGVSNVLANGATTVNITNLGSATGPTFAVAGPTAVDFLAENDGTILITGPTGATFSDTGIGGPFTFTGDLAAGSGIFGERSGGPATRYTYDIASGGRIALGVLGATPEPLPSTTLGLGALGVALLTFRSRHKVKAAI